jgi:hypothetical protein
MIQVASAPMAPRTYEPESCNSVWHGRLAGVGSGRLGTDSGNEAGDFKAAILGLRGACLGAPPPPGQKIANLDIQSTPVVQCVVVVDCGGLPGWPPAGPSERFPSTYISI